jgi:hypothetical protein
MNRHGRIAFATRRGLSALTDDDRLALDYLNARGLRAESKVWDDASVDWKEFDCVIIRSCWDYHLRPIEFLCWISSLERERVSLWNSPSVIRWNLDKSYLRDLEQDGITIAPTAWIEKSGTVNLSDVLETHDWAKAVVKPTISATAFQTFVTSPATARKDQALLDNILLRSGAMVQQFVEQISTQGEWSFIFFNKEYSHAVLKRAKGGEFRVQQDFGGYLASGVLPSDALIEQAQTIVDCVEEPLLYARVDGVEQDRAFVLMELELIEPYLFFSSDFDSVGLFTNALMTINEARFSTETVVVWLL